MVIKQNVRTPLHSLSRGFRERDFLPAGNHARERRNFLPKKFRTRERLCEGVL